MHNAAVKLLFFRVSSVVMNGSKYKKGYAVISGLDELTQYPAFHVIQDIFIRDSNVWLGVVKQDTVDYLPHFNAWRIKAKVSTHIFNLDKLQCLLPRPLPNAPTSYSFITLHHAF